MTVHTAKGLEFDHVFVVGMEEDLFPSNRAKFDPKSIEEERRLFYVAITRAKKTCTISYAKSRFKNGSINFTRESLFLKDIDQRYLTGDQPKAPRGESTHGFWHSLQQEKAGDGFSRKVEPAEQLYPEQTKPYSTPERPLISLSEEPKVLQAGNVIEHERFGRGRVISVEGSDGDKRAFVAFDYAGQKQLLLKYAKFKIIE